MKRKTLPYTAILFCVVCSALFAMYEVAEKGTWPESWPKELEPLRTQARTFVGPMVNHEHYAISFTKREQFEAAWPHFLKVKSKGAPIILVRKMEFFDVKPAGVLIHTPPPGHDKNANPEKPLAGNWEGNEREQWMWTTYIELVVDGEIVDLNRIALPNDTLIIDQRFEDKNDGSKKL